MGNQRRIAQNIADGKTSPSRTTVKGRLIAKLVDHGMFENHAIKVMGIVTPILKELSPALKLNGPQDTSLDGRYAVLWPTVKVEALRWIDDNLSKPWYRPMFL